MQNHYTLFYLCCPYTHKDSSIQEERFTKATKVTLHLVKNGIWVFSPISYTDPLVKAGGLGVTWADWEDHDLSILSHCDGIIVLKLDGWDRSTGVMAEIAYMQIHKPEAPIMYFTEDEMFNGTALVEINKEVMFITGGCGE